MALTNQTVNSSFFSSPKRERALKLYDDVQRRYERNTARLTKLRDELANEDDAYKRAVLEIAIERLEKKDTRFKNSLNNARVKLFPPQQENRANNSNLTPTFQQVEKQAVLR